MGLRFSCLQLQLIKPTKTSKIIYKRTSRGTKRIPPPPPPRNNYTNNTSNTSRAIPPPPPPRKNTNNERKQINTKLCEYHNITSNNNLCVPANPRDASLTASNISALSSAASVISALSSNVHSPTFSSDTSSETSLSILTAQNETSISSSRATNNVASHPVSPSHSRPFLIRNFTPSYDGDAEPSNESVVADVDSATAPFLSPMNMTISSINNNIEMTANRLSMTTQLSQLTNEENVKVITLTQTMDIQDIEPKIYKMYNGGLVAVKSTSVTSSPNVEHAIHRYPICDAINENSKCLNNVHQTQYGQRYIG